MSLETWEPDPFLDHFFLIGNDLLSVSQKVDTELGQATTSQARSRDTEHLLVRPSNLAARALRSVEHTPSKFGHDPSRVRRGLAAAVKCYVRKARFFRCPDRLWNRTREARTLLRIQHHKEENMFCILFSDPIIVGLMACLNPIRPCGTEWNGTRQLSALRDIFGCRSKMEPERIRNCLDARLESNEARTQGRLPPLSPQPPLPPPCFTVVYREW